MQEGGFLDKAKAVFPVAAIVDKEGSGDRADRGQQFQGCFQQAGRAHWQLWQGCWEGAAGGRMSGKASLTNRVLGRTQGTGPDPLFPRRTSWNQWHPQWVQEPANEGGEKGEAYTTGR